MNKAASDHHVYPMELCDRIGRAVACHLARGDFALAERVVSYARDTLEEASREYDRLRRGDREPSDIAIGEIGVANRLTAYFDHEGMLFVDEVLALEPRHIVAIRGVGLKTIVEVREALARLGFDWMPDIESTWREHERQASRENALAKKRRS